MRVPILVGFVLAILGLALGGIAAAAGEPETTIDSGPSDPTNSATASFTFSSDQPTATFECDLDGGGYVACPTPQDYPGLADGPHTFSVRATDATTGIDPTPASSTFTVDTVAPATTIATGPPDPTNSTTATFTFSSDEAATFVCSLDGAAFAACPSPKTYTGLTQGSHTVEVQAVDTAGNTDPTPASSTFTVDTVAPATTIATGPPDPTNSTTATFTFSSDEAATFVCSLDGAAFAACPSPKTYTGLTQGSHTVEVQAVDTAGNTDPTPASSTFTVDTVAPSASVTGGPAGATNDRTPSFTFTAEAGAGTQCRIDGAAFAACTGSYTSPATLAEGAHTFEVKATDAATNTATANRVFTVDITPPDTFIIDGVSGVTTVATPTFRFVGIDGAASFQCAIDSTTAFGPCSGPGGQHKTTALANGPHTFYVRAGDAAGNVDPSPDSRSFTVQSVRPTASFGVSPTAPLSFTPLTFTATSTDADGTIVLNEWDLDNDGAYDDATGTVVTTVFQTPGDHVVRLRSTDNDGGPSEAVQIVTVANRAPSASFVLSPSAPVAKKKVTFTSTSSDPDGPAPQVAWDLDNDGAFDDGVGATAAKTFAKAGRYTVRLRAVDGNGGVTVSTRVVTVAAPAAATFLAPSPIVRIAGVVTSRGVRLRLLTVRAPSGTIVELRCKGRSCPRSRTVVRATSKLVTFKAFSRTLRAGVVLEIRVTKAQRIGKYTRFRVRAGKAPERLDRCLMPGKDGPVRCPSA